MNKWIAEYSKESFENKYNYTGKLGAIYSKEQTTFILWAPTATEVKVILYKDKEQHHNMTKGNYGEWSSTLKGDLKNTYYNYSVKIDGIENVLVDPYAKAVGVNGLKGMVIALEETNPEGWNKDKSPILLSPTDSILYEMHIRDFSIDENSGVDEGYKGKYLGLVQENTVVPGTNIKTTLDHLKELGVTHVHLLPTFDYKSVDESINSEQYNWGYDPQNYNALEGSYSTDAFDGSTRIKEFKQAILKLHKSGIRVVMDVVYNHTFDSENSCLNLAVPYYYHRTDENGEFSNGSACGNELASERKMVRKYIVDSVVYFANEYHIDGFRFDLMGLHDIDTMKEIRKELDKIDSSIIIYGEGWKGGNSPLPQEISAIKNNTSKFDKLQIACFSDDIRDGIKGDVFETEIPGFINGMSEEEESIKTGVVASIEHEGVKYKKGAWAKEPYQTITYNSAHDNYTLWDKLQLSSGNVSNEELIAMNKLAAAIVLTSQGIPFLHAGEEFLRTKTKEDGSFEENSYNSPDYINKLDWRRKEKYIEVFNYYKGLIELRRTYKEFKLETADEIRKSLKFLKKNKDFKKESIVAFNIKGINEFIVIYNANKEVEDVKIGEGAWSLLVNEKTTGIKEIEEIKGGIVQVAPLSTYVLLKK